ncbi:hypothetical protein SDC9_204994 [bioreactor metagenome]|uniref:Uncharacterized protein n=1 Tax=bioreactor metagenome TaxID=1076179 RepID=A0A645J2A2_9ZZZZ
MQNAADDKPADFIMRKPGIQVNIVSSGDRALGGHGFGYAESAAKILKSLIARFLAGLHND